MNELEIKEKIEKSLALIRSIYYESSILKELVRVKDSYETEEEFMILYIRHAFPIEWFTRTDIATDYVLGQYGNGFASSETKHITDRIRGDKRIDRQRFPEITYNVFKEKMKECIDKGVNPSIALIPVSHFTSFHTGWRGKPELRIKDLSRFEIFNKQLRIIWSNKSMPFEEFVFVDIDYGTMYFRVPFQERLEAEINPSDKVDELDLLVKMTYKLEITNPEKIRILQEE